MADIDKIKLPNNTTYNIKDTVARGYNTTIAPVEASTTAVVEHPLGSIFYINNVLYRALDDILIGDTIVTEAGGNATQTTVAQNFKRVVTLTSQEYSQLSDAEKDADIVYIITDDNSITANNVSYDPTTSGMTATNVQNAVNELATNKAPAGYGLGVMMRDVGTSVTDCNNVNVTGWFDVSTTAANRPSGVTNTNACLYSVVRGPQFAYQEFYFYDGTNQRVFCRFRNTVNTPQWTSWKEIAYANKSVATEQQIATIETGTTASQTYHIGQYFCKDGLLYRVTAEISSGATFTVGTNCVSTTAATWLPQELTYNLTTNAKFTSLSGKVTRVGNTVILSFRGVASEAMSSNTEIIRIPYAPPGSDGQILSMWRANTAYTCRINAGTVSSVPNGRIYINTNISANDNISITGIYFL